MKYEDLKDEVRVIAEIADSVPTRFKERCFEILLERLLDTAMGEKEPGHKMINPLTDPLAETDAGKMQQADAATGKIPMPSQIKVLMQKTGISPADLGRIVMYEEGLHFVQEPKTQKIARGQIEWALLLALKNGVEKNVLSVDPETVRSICQEKGFYDATNFQKNFKSAKTAAYFQGPMEKQGEAQKLTAEGMDELGKIIKDLALVGE